MAELLASQDAAAPTASHEALKKRVADAEARLRGFQAAIEAGVDPATLVEAINEAQAQRAAARAELEGTPAPDMITGAGLSAL